MSPKILVSLLFIVNLFNQVILIKGEDSESEEGSIDYGQEKIQDMKSTFFNTETEGIHYIGNKFIEGTVIAFADINNDKMTDIITYKDNGDGTFQFLGYTYRDVKNNYGYNKKELFTISDSTNLKNAKVRNVHVGSYGNNYCMIVSFTLAAPLGDGGSLLHYYTCEGSTNAPTALDMHSNILIANLDGGKDTELLYYNYTAQIRQICKLSSESCNFLSNFTEFAYCPDKISCPNYKDKDLSLNGGMAYVDIDGNCNPDVILTHDDDGKRYIEVYKSVIVDKVKKYYLSSENVIILESASEYAAFTLSNINDEKKKGYAPMLDLLIPNPKNSSVLILYNQKKISYDWTDNYFEKHSPNNGISQFYNITTSQKVEKLEFNRTEFTKVVLDESYPTVIRTGDFLGKANNGLIVTHNVTTTSGETKKYVCLYYRDESSKKFKLYVHFDLTNLKVPDEVKFAVFFDVAETGSLDIIIQTNSSAYFFYNYIHEIFFVKSKLMNSENAHSNSDLGTTYRYIVTDRKGNRRMDISNQLMQTSDMTMALPYSLMGIDLTNNYVENFHTISGSYYDDSYKAATSGVKNYKQNTPIIPNTQMMIYKYLNKNNKIEWTVDLIVQPMDKIWVFLIIVVVVLLIVLGVIIYLHVKEVQEERKETTKFKSWFA